MDSSVLARILTKLGTMEGKFWPALREDEPMDADRASYAEVLIDLNDIVGAMVLRQLLTAFPKRPSHQALRQWAVSLVPPPSFDIRRLGTPAPSDAPRLTGPVPVAAGIPPHVRAVFESIRHKQAPGSAEAADCGDWGVLIYHPDGRKERCKARHSKEKALRIAEENGKKYPGHTFTVWQREASAKGAGGPLSEVMTR